MSIHQIRAGENPFERRPHLAEDDGERHEMAFAAGNAKVRGAIQIKDEELRAIIRGVQRGMEAADAEFQYYIINKRIVALGMIVICALAVGILFYRYGTPPLLYALPVGLSFIYIILIAVSELRFDGDRGA